MAKREINTSCFLHLVSSEAPVSQIFMENTFFCELFLPIWFCLQLHPRGLVYSSVHLLRNQNSYSDLQFHCVIMYTDERFLLVCLFCVFMKVLRAWGRDRCLTRCYAVCPSIDVIGTNVGVAGSLHVSAGSDGMVMCAINFHPGINHAEPTATETPYRKLCGAETRIWWK